MMNASESNLGFLILPKDQTEAASVWTTFQLADELLYLLSCSNPDAYRNWYSQFSLIQENLVQARVAHDGATVLCLFLLAT